MEAADPDRTTARWDARRGRNSSSGGHKEIQHWTTLGWTTYNSLPGSKGCWRLSRGIRVSYLVARVAFESKRRYPNNFKRSCAAPSHTYGWLSPRARATG